MKHAISARLKISWNCWYSLFAQRLAGSTAILLFISLIITACSFNPFIENNRLTGSPVSTAIGAGAGAGTMALIGGSKPLIALGGIGGGIIGYYVSTLRFAAGGIIQAGGQVYQIGDYVGIYIPTDQLFGVNTDEWRPQAFTILDSAVNVLKRYPNNNIIISGNTSGFNQTRYERHLSEQRAKQVAAYLWNAGINQFKEYSNCLRTLRYVGYGDFFPISRTEHYVALRQNSYIQIVSSPSAAALNLDRHHQALLNAGSPESDID
jgi:flagellar motor protein MotB